jgi:antitoxin CptB
MELARLKWQCRRGSLELDLLVQRYVDTVYLYANEAQQAQFDELLKLEDEALMAVLIKLGS